MMGGRLLLLSRKLEQDNKKKVRVSDVDCSMLCRACIQKGPGEAICPDCAAKIKKEK